MMNLDQATEHWQNRSGQLADRVNKALVYRGAAQRGELTESELRELLQDLKRLDDIELAAAELDQQIAFDECIDLLLTLPVS